MANNNDKKILNVPNLRFPEFSGEWKAERLNDIAKLTKGVGISKDQLSENGEPCILYGELYTKYKSEIIDDVLSKTDIPTDKLMRSKANDVIIPCSGETAVDIATARCVSSDNVLLGGDLNIIRLKPHNGSFISYQLNGKRKYDIAKVAQGVSVVHLYGEHLKGIVTYNPQLDEQKKIVRIISSLDERIATQNKIIEDLKSLIKGLEERLLRTGTDNYSLNKLCSIQSGYSGMQEILPQGLKVSRIETISQGVVNMDKVGYVKPFGNAETYKLHIGNILFSNINSVPYIGNLAYIEDDYELYHGMNLLRLIPNTDYILPKYLFYCLRDIKMKSYFQRICNKAVSQASINQTDLGKVEICIPCKERQSKIVDSIDSLEQKLTQNIHLKDLFHSQKTALLQQMFI